MSTKSLSSLLLLVILGAIWSGCDSETGIARTNLQPNTRISAGPPERSDTGFSVNLFWFGWDEDGFIDHYEIAWEDPSEENFAVNGQVFTNDSLFTLQASEFCCLNADEILPDFGDPEDLPDSVYEQFHTFYVRAIDNNGMADPTPAVRSFNSQTIAPFTEIAFGPRDNGRWGTDVEFEWVGADDDGVVESYLFALVTAQEWRDDQGIEFHDTNPPSQGAFVAWLDTLTYRPILPCSDPDGGCYDTNDPVWKSTVIDTILFQSLPPTDASAYDWYMFGVRAIDNAGAVEKVLSRDFNTRKFDVVRNLDGPRVTMTSNIAGVWHSSAPAEIRQIFGGQGLRFDWTGGPGPSQTPVAGFSFAIDDTNDWEPFSINTVQFPPQPDPDQESLWFPSTGSHSFFLRAIDEGGFIRLLVAKFTVFGGPRRCEENDRFILIVLDTDESSLSTDNIWPVSYRALERSLIDYYFEGFNYQVHEADAALNEPTVSLMNCASSTFWFLSGDTQANDGTILEDFHQNPPNPLPSYISSGGNLFLCGVHPSTAMAYLERHDLDQPVTQNHPLLFLNTLDSAEFIPHWAATHLGISAVRRVVPNTSPAGRAPDRLRLAKSMVTDGPRPYPDLEFDCLTWPGGCLERGFGYYDYSVEPLSGDPRYADAEVIYRLNETNVPIAVRKLSPAGPGINGNVIYLGFHPYFVDRPSFKMLIQAVLADFGELPTSSS